jgi:hypothetical protein
MSCRDRIARTAGRWLMVGACALGVSGLMGCSPTVVEDRTPDTTVVNPPSAPKTEVVPVPVPGPQGAPGPAGPAGPAGAPGK